MSSDPAHSALRRRLLAAAWSLASTGVLAPSIARSARAPRFDAYPFTLGVASGCPRPNGIVLWTRLAPDPLHAGGMSPEAVDVRWELARDEGLRDIVRRGVEHATPGAAHSVHV